MNPWDQNNNNEIDNMTTYLSATMFKMRIDPNASASLDQYKDVDNTTAKEEEPAEGDNGASNGEKDEETREEAANNDDPPAETKDAESNPGATPGTEATPSPAVPPGVPTANMTPVPVAPVAAPTQAAGGEPILEERGEVSQLFVGRVIGKGGEVRMILITLLERMYQMFVSKQMCIVVYLDD